MRNYVQPGNVLTLTAPRDLSSGDGLAVGSIFGVAAFDALTGAEVEAALTGVYDLPKTASQAWTVGVPVYWDDEAKEATTTASNSGTDNLLIGVAVLAVGSGAGETTGRVRLNGSF